MKNVKLLEPFSLILLFCMLSIYGYSTNYYVSDGQGLDTNPGTVDAPFKTIQQAANLTNPGDTVFIMNGTYVRMSGAQLLSITRSGTAGASIVYTPFPGHTPILKKNEFVRYAIVIQPGTSYIVLEGLILQGNNQELTLEEAIELAPLKSNKTNGVGINIRPSQDPVTKQIKACHHIVIRGCSVTDFPSAGINVGSDYTLVENNLIARNSWYGSSGGSGLTVYRPYSIDANKSEYKIIVRNNVCHSNHQYVDWVDDEGVNHGLTDGNGIIFDQHQLGPKGFTPNAPYQGRILVANNISYNNGGTGIHAYYSSNIDIINNTAYFNNQGPRNSGQIHASNASNVRLLNNIMWAKPGKAATTFRNNTASVIYDYNIYYDGDLSTSYSTDSSGTIRNNIIADPKFVNAPTDFSLAAPSDFKLRPGSPAINSGIVTGMPDTDFEGNPRPYGSGIDRGAFEFTAVVLPDSIGAYIDESNIQAHYYVSPTGLNTNTGTSPQQALANPFVAIERANANSLAEGLVTKIHIANGTYTIARKEYDYRSSAIAPAAKSTTLIIEGETYRSVILDGNNTGRLNLKGKSNLVMRNLVFTNCGGEAAFKAEEFYGNGASVPQPQSRNWRIEYCAFNNNKLRGLRILHVDHLTMEHCEVKDNLDDGFQYIGRESHLNDILVSGNDKPDANQADFGNGGFNFSSKRSLVENMTVRDNRGAGFRGDFQNENVIVRNCIFEDNQGGGMTIEVTYGPVEIKNCRIERNNFGVKVSASHNITIDSCRIAGNKDTQIDISSQFRDKNGDCGISGPPSELDSLNWHCNPARSIDGVRNTTIRNSFISTAKTDSSHLYTYETFGNQPDKTWYEKWYKNEFIAENNVYAKPDTISAFITDYWTNSTENSLVKRMSTLSEWKALTGSDRNSRWDITGSLPVKLILFTATADGKNVNLRWATASETNNAYFTVEHSVDGKNFIAIATVKGAGNSSQHKEYSTVDQTPFTGINYYRIKQTDLDGHYVFSEIKSVKISKVQVAKLTVLPNPVINKATITYQLPQADRVLLEIYTIEGRKVATLVNREQGAGQRQVMYNSNLLPEGMYILKLSAGKQSDTIKLMVIK